LDELNSRKRRFCLYPRFNRTHTCLRGRRFRTHGASLRRNRPPATGWFLANNVGRGRPYPRITHLPRDSIFACLEHCRASIIALEKSRIAALESSDIEALSALWAQTDVDTGETRHRSGKAEVLRVLELGALKHVRSRRKRLEGDTPDALPALRLKSSRRPRSCE
jgi:hypothetical protein